MYHHGVQAEVNRLKWEVEIYEKHLNRIHSIATRIAEILQNNPAPEAQVIKSLIAQL